MDHVSKGVFLIQIYYYLTSSHVSVYPTPKVINNCLGNVYTKVLEAKTAISIYLLILFLSRRDISDRRLHLLTHSTGFFAVEVGRHHSLNNGMFVCCFLK